MSEQAQTLEEIFAQMSPAEQRQFLQQAEFERSRQLLNQNQQALANMPTLPQPYQYQKPDSLGSALRGAVKNLLLPAQQQLGLAPTIKGQLANMQYQEFQRELLNEQNEKIRENMGRQLLLARGADPRAVAAMSGTELMKVLAAGQGGIQTDQFGNTYQESDMTGERTMVNTLPQDMQEYFYENPGALNPNQQAVLAPGSTEPPVQVSGEPPLSMSAFKRQNKFLDEAGTNAQQKMFATSEAYQTNALGAVDQLKRLQDMESLLLNRNFDTGGGQELILGLQNLGYNLGLTDANPTEAQVFNALATGFIIPAAKSLGVNPTDKDMELLQKAAPELGKTPQGNLILIKAKQIEAQRAIMLQNAFLAFQKENLNDYQINPAQFEINWKMRLNELIQSEEFAGAGVLELKAQAASLLGRNLNIEQALDNL